MKQIFFAGLFVACVLLIGQWWQQDKPAAGEKVGDIDNSVIETPVTNGDDEHVACTMDAKQCPDGSFVGRTGPNCEFAPCPIVTAPSESVVCSTESRKTDACVTVVEPVCGLVRVECVTTPCDPIPETFTNSCEACRNERVVSYTEGACQ